MTQVTPTMAASSSEFIESVLDLRPQLAVFDCDGTLWSGDAGERFFNWELKRGVLSDDVERWVRARFADYKAGKVTEDDMCGEMVTIHSGLVESEVQRLAKEFFDENFVKQIFPEMRHLVQRLQSQGCDIWVVSSTNEWVIQAAMKHFGIEAKKILAAAVEIDAGRITNRLIRVPSGEGKPRAIREVIGKDPNAAFGNSRWDAAMLAIAQHGFAVNPNPDLEQVARERGWRIYWPNVEKNRDNNKDIE
ncbi:MAG TPA: HAD-IB family phosphatase [Terriglobales bacterium]|nr:HAD-IB family phosphatase [Terriglobales bacterium]